MPVKMNEHLNEWMNEMNGSRRNIECKFISDCSVSAIAKSNFRLVHTIILHEKLCVRCVLTLLLEININDVVWNGYARITPGKFGEITKVAK